MEKLTLGNLKNGAVDEVFQRELANVLKNMSDPNTSNTKARSITIKLNFKPDKKRESGKLSFNVKSTLCPVEEMETIFVMDAKSIVEIGNSSPGQMVINIETGEIEETPIVKDGKLKIVGQ